MREDSALTTAGCEVALNGSRPFNQIDARLGPENAAGVLDWREMLGGRGEKPRFIHPPDGSSFAVRYVWATQTARGPSGPPSPRAAGFRGLMGPNPRWFPPPPTAPPCR